LPKLPKPPFQPQIIEVKAETGAEAIKLARKQLRKSDASGWRCLRTTVGHLSCR